MEETVWLYFSVLAVIIALTIVGVLVLRNEEAMDQQHFVRSIEELKSQCNFVCDSGVGTNLPVEVIFPSGSQFYTKKDKICGTYVGKSQCRLCSCQLEEYFLDLNTTFAREVLKSHKYTCYMERKNDVVSINCQG